jgi:putative protein-disulfide isomerase
MPTLHYIYDPLCGWCYAGAPLLDTLINHYPDMPIFMHAGGLFFQQPITEDIEQHIREHDARIHKLSGQPFGDNYLYGLLNDDATLLDSPRVIPAMLAMEKLDKTTCVPMLKAIQDAHYVDGLKVVEREVLAELANKLGQATRSFLRAYDEFLGAPTDAHMAATRKLMTQMGEPGFPAFVIQEGEQMRLFDHNALYGKPQEFIRLLKDFLNQ